MSTPPRRPSLSRPHTVRAVAEAARASEAPADVVDSPPAPRAEDRAPRRLSDGRVSYAGKAGTVYFPTEDDRQRVKNAFRARGGIEGYTSESEWWADVILAAAEQWETDYNGGRPFEVPARPRRRG